MKTDSSALFLVLALPVLKSNSNSPPRPVSANAPQSKPTVLEWVFLSPGTDDAHRQNLGKLYPHM